MCCVVAKFTNEYYTTINQSTAGRFDPRVFVNCLQVEKCCERRVHINSLHSQHFSTCKQLTKTLGSKLLLISEFRYNIIVVTVNVLVALMQ